MHQFTSRKDFLKKAKKFIKKNQRHREKLDKTISLLIENPFNLSLQTHRVQHRFAGKAFSSRLTGNIRIIWDFTKDDKNKILLIDLGGHSGKNKVCR